MTIRRTVSLSLACAALVYLSAARADWIELSPGAAADAVEPVLLEADQHGALFELTFTGLEVTEVDTPFGVLTRVRVPGCGITGRVGEPQLPACRVHIEIPQGATPSLEVVDAAQVSTTAAALGIGERLWPRQAPIPKLPGAVEAAEFALDEQAYATVELAPSEQVRLGEIGEIRGHRFIEVEVQPLRYAPGSGAIEQLQRIVIHVGFSGGQLKQTAERIARYRSVPFDRFAHRAFLNSETFMDKAAPPLPIGYLIIVEDQFVDAVADLAAFKHDLGYHVAVTPTSAITDGSLTADIITAYIQNEYGSAAIPPTFVLLVGDTQFIPPRIVVGGYQDRATDHYFSTMDGSADWLPDLFVGRFPADNIGDVELLVDKTLSYSAFALSSGDGWIKNALFMASVDNYEISEGTHNYVINNWLAPDGYFCDKQYCVSEDATTGQVISGINAGVSQLTYSGHGYSGGWADGPEMDIGDVSGLANVEMWPVVQSYACDTGMFTEDDCFAEAWVLDDNGAVAYWGSSVNSYWDEDDVLERAMYDAWYGDGVFWIRGSLNEGLWGVYEEYSGGGLTQQYYEQYNLFGDPSLDVWTAAPSELDVEHADEAYLGDESFAVSVLDPGGEPVVEALVAVRMEDGLYAAAYTDAAGEASLALDPPIESTGTLDVHASKHNFLPYAGEAEVLDGPDGDTDVDGDGDVDGDADTDSAGPGQPYLWKEPSGAGCGCRSVAAPTTAVPLIDLLTAVL